MVNRHCLIMGLFFVLTFFGEALDLAAETGSGLDYEAQHVFLLNGEALARVRATLMREEERFWPMLERLRADADSAMEEGPFSVVFKAQTPPSGDKHDYLSIGKYWWPNPDTSGGLPYVPRDGHVNPEATRGDAWAKWQMQRSVVALAHAYYFTGNEPYADRAACLLRTWFLDEETRMNPHLEFAQGVPGRTSGRSTGTIEMRTIPELLDAIGLLSASEAWNNADQDALIDWFRDYLRWLLESGHGQQAAQAGNNIGTWYDVQTAGIALFVGRKDVARESGSVSAASMMAVGAGLIVATMVQAGSNQTSTKV